jgi:hypothetical protein
MAPPKKIEQRICNFSHDGTPEQAVGPLAVAQIVRTFNGQTLNPGIYVVHNHQRHIQFIQ